MPSRREREKRSVVAGDGELTELLVDSIREYAIYALDPAGHVVTWNAGARRLKGYEVEEIVGTHFSTFFTETDRTEGLPQRMLERALTDGQFEGEGWRVRKDGSLFWANAVITPLRKGDGSLRGFAKVTRDMTARRAEETRTREALQTRVHERTADLYEAHVAYLRTRRRLEGLERSGMVGILVAEPRGRVHDANDAMLAMLQYQRSELEANAIDWMALTPPEWREASQRAVDEVRARGRAAPFEKEFLRKDGSRARFVVSLARLDDATNLACVIEVTQLRRAEAALRQSTAFNDQIVRSVREGITVLDHDLRYVGWNGFMEDITGLPSAQVLGKIFADLTPELVGTEAERVLRRALAGEHVSMPVQKFFAPRRGRDIWLAVDVGPLLTAEGTVSGILATTRDVTGQREADAALRESERRFRQLANAIHEVFWMTSLDRSEIIYVSPGYERLWGRTCESLYQSPSAWMDAVHADDRAALTAVMGKAHEAGSYDEQYRIVRPDGTTRWIHDRAFVVRDEAGEIVALAGVAADVTAQRQLELQLRQAQKMEAVGQLAGGVAHDFNNLLTVVAANCAFLLEHVTPDSEEALLVGDIRDAGARAAGLTQQLLAFSRRQRLEAKVIDVNAAVREVTRLLTRLLGEDVALTVALAPAVDRVRVDPGHLTQVLLNLAVNARDAMPRGGKLTIETKPAVLDDEYAASRLEVRPGRYVMISMTDTGEGMTPEVRARVFEPFFTTKGVGRGTGLGLSVVHGIVNQSGGHLALYSEVGIGTTFKVYLPAVDESLPEALPLRTPRLPDAGGTILLVEDDAAVRKAARRMLESAGYTVVMAHDGRHALEVYEALGLPIDLLLTDVVMPELAGMPLAAALKSKQPGLRVLFTSGYTDEAIVRHGVLASSSAFLQKPYSRDGLLARVLEVLQSPPEP